MAIDFGSVGEVIYFFFFFLVGSHLLLCFIGRHKQQVEIVHGKPMRQLAAGFDLRVTSVSYSYSAAQRTIGQGIKFFLGQLFTLEDLKKRRRHSS